MNGLRLVVGVCGRQRGHACCTHTAYMLAGRTEPLPVRNQHERRPQAGGVVSAVAGVAQQDLRAHTQTQRSDTGAALTTMRVGAHQLGVVGQPTVAAGVLDGVLLRLTGFLRVGFLLLPTAPLSWL